MRDSALLSACVCRNMKLSQVVKQNETGIRAVRCHETTAATYRTHFPQCSIVPDVQDIFNIVMNNFRVWILSDTFGSTAFIPVSNGRIWLQFPLYYLGLGCSGSFRVSLPIRHPYFRSQCFSVRQSSALHPFQVGCSSPSTFLSLFSTSLFRNCSVARVVF